MTKLFRFFTALVLSLLLWPDCGRAQAINASQAVVLQGLRATSGHGALRAAAFAPDGSLLVLDDEHDGIRLFRSSSDGSNLLAQAHIGSTGDSGVAMALDPSGNIYVAGTSSSGTLTGTSGVVHPTPADRSTNSFLAKFDPHLNLVFLTFLGAGRTLVTGVTATADSAFVTGITYNTTFPVTPGAIQQTPASGSSQNGFAERLNATGTELVYATYLTGFGGDTTPAAIAADSGDNAYIAGSTTASGYPTITALQPERFGSPSGFLSKLTPAGNGFVFSTFIAGSGITSLALDASTNSLLLSGSVDLGDFPITAAQSPIAPVGYQALLRIPEDGQSLTSSVLLVPGTSSFVAPRPNGTAWISGVLTAPIFPGLTPVLASTGDTFLVHVNSANQIDQTFRIGAQPKNNASYASLTSLPAAPAVSADGKTAAVPLTLTAIVSASLSATQRFELPLIAAPNALLPSTLRDVATTCTSGQCYTTGGLLSEVSIGSGTPSLALSADDTPNVLLQNLGSTTVNGIGITTTAYMPASDCGSSLAPSATCEITLSGTGPGSLTITSSNAATATASLPASSASPDTVALSTEELDFGIATPTVSPARTVTITNLTAASQTFTAAQTFGGSPGTAFSATATTCASPTTGSYSLAANASCTLTFTLSLPSSPSSTVLNAGWTIAGHLLTLRGVLATTDLEASASTIDFGTQFTGAGAIRLPRILYLSNNGDTPIAHNAILLPDGSPFSATDNCPTVLEPHTVCAILLTYEQTTAPATDSTTLTLDDGQTVLLTGRTLLPASVTGSAANPSLSVSPGTLNFTAPVLVTQTSGSTQTVTISNIGANPLAVALATAGDFTLTTNCPTTLPGNSTCSAIIGFSPSQPGTRSGLLSVTGGSGFAPSYVTLTGTATGLLQANNGELNMGEAYVGEPVVAWYKVTQAVAHLTVTTGSPEFGVALVEDTGSGHGTLPASSFTQTATSSCSNCWIGVQFLSGAAGPAASTLTLDTNSGGNPYVVSVTATALPVSGLLLTPVTQDFGPITVNSSSAPIAFTLANLLPNSPTAQIQSVTASGDFAVAGSPLGGPACTGALGSTSACSIGVIFSPTATGQRSGALTVTTDQGTATTSLTGYGEPDPGIAFNPAALVFTDQPGTAATQQAITVSNTSGAPLTLGTPASSNTAFAVTSNCGATLIPGQLCQLTVTFTPQSAQISGNLTLPVTETINGQPTTTTYTLPVSGAYTSQNAGLSIQPNIANFGATAIGSLGLTRQFTLTNSSAKPLNITLQMPQQFPLANPGACATLASDQSCVFSVSYLPATNSEATGTVTALGTPTDGSRAIQALAYMIGFGQGQGTLTLSGSGLIPNTPLNFGQIASSKTAQQVLTLGNTGLTPVTVHRITSEPPFYSTTTCGPTLAPNKTCTITLIYAPTNEVGTGTSGATRTDNGQLTIESDASDSPLQLAMLGSVLPLTSSSPSSNSVLATYSLSQGALTFANTGIGNASPAQTVTLTNTGNRTLHISNILAPVDFTETNTCTTLLAGDTCTITVTFTPGTASISAVRSGSLEISSDAAISLQYLTLLGPSSPAPLMLLPTTLDFGTVSVGSTSTLPVQITNVTSTPITFLSETATSAYTTDRGTCPAAGSTLAAGSSCSLNITFTPTIIGQQTGTLTLQTDATQLPLTVALTGIGVASHLVAKPTALAFGTIAVGSPANLALTLSNTGNAAVTNIATSLAGANAADFAVTAPCSTTSLAANQGCAITVTFTPSGVGTKSATLSIASSDPASPLLIPLTGSGAHPGSFALTVAGGHISSTMTVKHGSPALYDLQLTPANGYTGKVALNCTPVTAGPYATCSLLASAIVLDGKSAQTSIATLNTITELYHKPALAMIGILALLPWWRRRTTRRWLPTLCCLLALASLITVAGCGGPSVIRYTPPGTYQYTVTASSTSGPAISSTVTLNLIVK